MYVVFHVGNVFYIFDIFPELLSFVGWRKDLGVTHSVLLM